MSRQEAADDERPLRTKNLQLESLLGNEYNVKLFLFMQFSQYCDTIRGACRVYQEKGLICFRLKQIGENNVS